MKSQKRSRTWPVREIYNITRLSRLNEFPCDNKRLPTKFEVVMLKKKKNFSRQMLRREISVGSRNQTTLINW